MSNELVDYIKKGVEKGHSLSKIKESLIDAGHSKESVEHAVSISGVKVRKFNIKPILIALVILAAIYAAYQSLDFLKPEERETGLEEVLPNLAYIRNYADFDAGMFFYDDYFECLAGATGKAEKYCAFVSEKDGCEDSVKMDLLLYNKQDVKCREFKNRDFKEMCSGFRSGQHIARDTSRCNKLVNQELKIACITWITEDLGLCVTELGEEECNREINRKRAYMTGNAELCQEVGEEVNCLAFIREDPSECNQLIENYISASDSKLFEIAASNGIIGACNRMISEEMALSCISALNLDVEKCRQVREQDARSMCMTYLAEFLRKPELCEEIGNETLKTECREFLGLI